MNEKNYMVGDGRGGFAYTMPYEQACRLAAEESDEHQRIFIVEGLPTNGPVAFAYDGKIYPVDPHVHRYEKYEKRGENMALWLLQQVHRMSEQISLMDEIVRSACDWLRASNVDLNTREAISQILRIAVENKYTTQEFIDRVNV